MDYDAIIVGGGIIGLSAAHKLATNGKKVAVLEKKRPGAGATGLSGGLIRVFDPEIELAEFAAESYNLFNTNKNIPYKDSFVKTGALYVRDASTRSETEHIIQILNQKYSYYSELLNKDQCTELYPNISWQDSESVIVVHEPNAGYADPLKISLSLVDKIEYLGSDILEGTEVSGFVSKSGKIEAVKTNIGSLTAKHFVIANGAWAASLDCPESVRSREIQIHFFQNSKVHPILIDETLGGLYARPCINGSSLVGVPLLEWDIDPDLKRSISCAENTRSIATQRLSSLVDAPLCGGRRGFDGYTQTNQGYIKKSDFKKNLIWAVGWSGCGFKLAPAIASRIFDIVA
ncbi:NAD(P)/FAD-dependent oxidoreductase [Endozoicomonas sp. ALB115]|uniref:NAD(P)/FAD-dependent oxidoreductase n=1 Tax=Endozoicomonas sp. ALB115 TaxID=3403074 RepID=UPI003BB7AC37